MLTIGVVTDIHLGLDTRFGGKLRKLSSEAPRLLAAFAARMGAEVHPDLVVNLGDVIEDESPEADRERYRQGIELLGAAPGRLIHVAGNHDRINLPPSALRQAWGLAPEGPLYGSLDVGGAHVVTLYTHERKDRDITIDAAQLEWLARDLDASSLPTVVCMHHSAAEQDLSANRWFAAHRHIALLAERQAFRSLLARHGRVVAVLAGHVHWNHLFVADGIPYVTIQSLVENVDDDAPGRAAAAHAVVRLTDRELLVEVGGLEPARYAFELAR